MYCTFQAANNKGTNQTAFAQSDLHHCCSDRLRAGFVLTYDGVSKCLFVTALPISEVIEDLPRKQSKMS